MDDDDTTRRYAQDEAKLGRAVRELREERGLTDRELADSIRGISLKGIRAIEVGEYKALTYERMVRLARALGVELGALFRRSEGLSAD
jgi:transcriptional regulator with XRE-family HTH domain